MGKIVAFPTPVCTYANQELTEEVNYLIYLCKLADNLKRKRFVFFRKLRMESLRKEMDVVKENITVLCRA